MVKAKWGVRHNGHTVPQFPWTLNETLKDTGGEHNHSEMFKKYCEDLVTQDYSRRLLCSDNQCSLSVENRETGREYLKWKVLKWMIHLQKKTIEILDILSECSWGIKQKSFQLVEQEVLCHLDSVRDSFWLSIRQRHCIYNDLITSVLYSLLSNKSVRFAWKYNWVPFKNSISNQCNSKTHSNHYAVELKCIIEFSIIMSVTAYGFMK